MTDEQQERLAEWLYRYKAYSRRPNAWRQLCVEQPDIAEGYRKDARRLATEVAPVLNYLSKDQ